MLWGLVKGSSTLFSVKVKVYSSKIDALYMATNMLFSNQIVNSALTLHLHSNVPAW